MESSRVILFLNRDGGRFVDWMLDFVSTLEVDVPTHSNGTLTVHLTPFWRMGIDSRHFDIHVLGCWQHMTDLVCREDLSPDGWCKVYWDSGATYGTEVLLTDHRNGLRVNTHGKHGLMRFEVVQFVGNRYEVRATCGHRGVLPDFLALLREIAKRWPETEQEVAAYCSHARPADELSLPKCDIWQRSELFRAVFATVKGFLEIYCSGGLLVPHDAADMQYVRWRQSLQDILGTPGMEELRPLPEDLPESLCSIDPLSLDIEWENILRPALLAYTGRVHQFCVRVERQFHEVLTVKDASELLGESADSIREKLGGESAESVPYPLFVRMLVKQQLQEHAQFVEWYRQVKAKETRRFWTPVEKSAASSHRAATQPRLRGKPSKPQEPPEGPTAEVWFRYYYDMKEAGYKYGHRQTAEKLGYGENTIRQKYSEWLAEHPELKESTNIS